MLPYAFAFARERAREASRLVAGKASHQADAATNARLSRFMAHDWIKETGHASKNPYDQMVLQELATVKQWLETSPATQSSLSHSAWASAALAPILQWEETMSETRNVASADIVNQ